MTSTIPRVTHIVSTLAVLACAGLPAAILGAPNHDPANVVGSLAAVPYEFAAVCDGDRPRLSINLVVRNDGERPSRPTPVVAQDSLGEFVGTLLLPPLAAGGDMPLALAMRDVAVKPGPKGATHVISTAVGAQRLPPLVVKVPANLCTAATPVPAPTPKPAATPPPKPGTVPTAAPMSGTTTVIGSKAKRTAPPGVSQVAQERSNTSNLIATALKPAIPTNVHGIGDHGAECLPHVGLLGTLVCPDMIKSGDLLLVWDWRPGNGPDEIDGYRVYRVDSGLKQLVYTRADKKDLTLVDVAKPSGGYTGKCYAVTAYAGRLESDLSPAFCASGGSVAKSIRLRANHLRWMNRYHTEAGFDLTAPFSAGEENVMRVGFEFTSEKHLIKDSVSNTIYRAAVAFDVSGFANKRLVSAKLGLHLVTSEGEGNNHSCAAVAGTGTEFWWLNQSWLGASFDVPNHADGAAVGMGDIGPDVSLDVTQMVGSWMRGNPNYGFVFKGADENLHAFTNKSCKSVYANPVLDITYY